MGQLSCMFWANLTHFSLEARFESVEAALAGLAFDAAICLMSKREREAASLAASLARAGKQAPRAGEAGAGVGSALRTALRHHRA